MAESQRSVLHPDHGFCADAGPRLLWKAPTELREKQLLIRLWLRVDVPGVDQFAHVDGREMHVEELFERGLQTAGREGDEYVRLDARLTE